MYRNRLPTCVINCLTIWWSLSLNERCTVIKQELSYRRHFSSKMVILNLCSFSALKKTTSIGTPPPNSCPVCGVHLSANELETHFLAELDRLYKLSSGSERQRIRNSFNLAPGIHPNNGLIQTPDNRWEVSNLTIHHSK